MLLLEAIARRHRMDRKLRVLNFVSFTVGVGLGSDPRTGPGGKTGSASDLGAQRAGQILRMFGRCLGIPNERSRGHRLRARAMRITR